MTEETRTALKNLMWLIQNRDDVEIQWESDTLLFGDGGNMVDDLIRPGFIPATREA